MLSKGSKTSCTCFHSKVPYPLPAKRRQFLASKWVIQAARDKSGVKTKLSMAQTLASELLEAYNNQVEKLLLFLKTLYNLGLYLSGYSH